MYKTVLYRIGRHALVCSLAILGGTATVALAFTEPSVGPTGGTVYAPINTGGTAQTKSGNFTSSGTLTGNTVNGTSNVCLSGNCISSWAALAGTGLSGGASTLSLNTTSISTCTNATTNKLYWDGTNSRLACGTDQTSAGGGWTDDGATVRLTTSTDSVGIGTASPTGRMELLSGSDSIRFLDSSTGINGTGIRHPYGGSTYLIGVGYNTSNNDMGLGVMQLPGTLTVSLFYSPSTNRDYLQTYGKDLYIETQTGSIGNVLIPSGNVGIGVPPAYKLDVAGDVNASGCFRGPGGSYAGTCVSDKLLKKNITSLSGSLEKIAALNPVSFEFNDPKYGAGLQEGLIAQEVEKIFPDWVTTGEDGYKRIRYGLELQMRLIGAVKEQQNEIESLKARIEALERR